MTLGNEPKLILVILWPVATSKVLATRLKDILHGTIAPSNLGIKGVIAKTILKWHGRLEFLVGRSLLIEIALTLNGDHQWCHFVLLTLLSTSSPSPPVKASKGLREGNPLIPYIFVVAANVLNNLLIEGNSLTGGHQPSFLISYHQWNYKPNTINKVLYKVKIRRYLGICCMQWSF